MQLETLLTRGVRNLDEFRYMYGPGQKSLQEANLRAPVDMRLLKAVEAGGDIDAFAEVVGVSRVALGNAIRRARIKRGDRLRRPRDITRRHKNGLAKQTRPICAGCRRRFKLGNLTIDHIVPLPRGGSNCRSNMRLMCAPCNFAKGSCWTRS
jgi:hypothetical protein